MESAYNKLRVINKQGMIEARFLTVHFRRYTGTNDANGKEKTPKEILSAGNFPGYAVNNCITVIKAFDGALSVVTPAKGRSSYWMFCPVAFLQSVVVIPP